MTTCAATPIDATSVKTTNETACSVAGIPICAIAAIPATMSRRFFGLRAESTTPDPAAFGELNTSSAPIHFGVGGSPPSCGRPRHCSPTAS